MGNTTWLTDFLFSSTYLVAAIGAIVVSGPEITKHRPLLHQTKVVPEKCDLICPGQPPLALPPNFIQNCTSASAGNNNNSSNPSKATTVRPSRTTTTQSSEESTETNNNATDSQNGTARIITDGKHHGTLVKRKNVPSRPPQTKRHHHHHHQSKQSPQLRQNKKVKKETVLFKKAATSRLLKHHKGLKERARLLLEGCYVVCSDGNDGGNGQPGYGGGGGGGGGNEDGDSDTDGEVDSNESDSGDNYVEGEDAAVEIIYIPHTDGDNRRPSEVYQINNYGLIDPQPAFSFGYDPFFREGKRKIRKKAHSSKKKSEYKKCTRRPPSKS